LGPLSFTSVTPTKGRDVLFKECWALSFAMGARTSRVAAAPVLVPPTVFHVAAGTLEKRHVKRADSGRGAVEAAAIRKAVEDFSGLPRERLEHVFGDVADALRLDLAAVVKYSESMSKVRSGAARCKFCSSQRAAAMSHTRARAHTCAHTH
jgi:hypothetical protein